MYSAANAVYVVGGAGFFTLAMQANKLGNDLKSDIAAFKADVKSDIAAVKAAGDALKVVQKAPGSVGHALDSFRTCTCDHAYATLSVTHSGRARVYM